MLGGVGCDPETATVAGRPRVADDLEEIAVAHDREGTVAEQRGAALALKRLRTAWKFHPVELPPVGHGIVERIAQSNRDRNCLPAEERNCSFVPTEAALLERTLLMTSDNHLLETRAGPLKIPARRLVVVQNKMREPSLPAQTGREAKKRIEQVHQTSERLSARSAGGRTASEIMEHTK